MLKKLNIAFVLFPIILFSFGYITLLSTSQPLVKSHLVFFLIGYFLFIVFSLLDYSVFKYIWLYVYGLNIVLLILTFFFASQRLGAARWLDFGFFTFQTSEYTKFALVIALSALISSRIQFINKLSNILLVFLLVTSSVIFILIQPDLGTSLVLILMSVGLVFYAGISKYLFAVIILLFGFFSTPIWHLLQDYQKERILVFLNPQLDVLGSGYNVIQSIIAVGSGGLLGKGFGRGTQANLEFLPAYWTDFIFASYAEEWGFLGVFLLITFFVLFLGLILYTSIKTSDIFGKLLCIGVFFIFFVQFTVNVGMNMGVMPVTGVTLPFISFGGTSMIFSLILFGLVHSVYLNKTD